METNKCFVVPYDFTKVADNALHHAIVTAKVVDATIYLFHVVDKKGAIPVATKKLKQLITSHNNEIIKIIPEVRVGSIFNDIGNFAEKVHADLIFMGTHGASGWQHVSGSYALRVVTHSSVPFIIVQKKTVNESGYDNIVVPLDLHRETKQKLTIVASMARYFKSKVHIATPKATDDFSKNKIEANILFAKRFFEERTIETTVTLVPRSGFDKEVVKVAIEKDADLIAIMNQRKNSLFNVFTSNYEQYMITNDAKIPTLIMNPIKSSPEISFL